MYIVCVTVKIKEGFVEKFIEATFENARNTRREPGNVRFDVLQAEDDPKRFFLYEVYREKDDFPRHQQTPHYIKWKAEVADMQAEPRQGVKHRNLFPANERF